MARSLIFVYNADSGLFNALADSAHKILSSKTYKCSLCAITHNALGKKPEWKSFINNFNTPLVFLHRDEFKQEYGLKNMPFPAIFDKEDEQLRLIINAKSINSCTTIPGLINLINSRVFTLQF